MRYKVPAGEATIRAILTESGRAETWVFFLGDSTKQFLAAHLQEMK